MLRNVHLMSMSTLVELYCRGGTRGLYLDELNSIARSSTSLLIAMAAIVPEIIEIEIALLINQGPLSCLQA